MLNLEKISKVYESKNEKINALKEISLKIERQDFVAIIGPSGSGKSTLLHVLGLLDYPTSGKYFIGEKNVSSLDDRERAYYRNTLFGFVFQDFYLYPRLNALDNVAIPTIFSNKNVPKENLMNVLKTAKIDHRATHTPMELSGGEKQRVAIARALVNDPAVIIADEPTGNLDSSTSMEILELFHHLNKERKKTIIIATHNTSMVKYCNKVVSLRDGSIEKVSTGEYQ
ncbi:MAG: ABC transporter ATP-binding protein [Thermoplasmata archaeon]